MNGIISGNVVGGSAPLKTVLLVDENGNEVATGVVVGQETIFTATDSDVRKGLVYAGDSGVSVGIKDIPAYRTEKGACMISNGDEFAIIDMEKHNQYDYTELQCIIAPFNTTPEDSVASEKIVLNDGVYLTNSTDLLAYVTKDANEKSIKLNIQNDSGQDYIVHYFTYRKED